MFPFHAIHINIIEIEIESLDKQIRLFDQVSHRFFALSCIHRTDIMECTALRICLCNISISQRARFMC